MTKKSIVMESGYEACPNFPKEFERGEIPRIEIWQRDELIGTIPDEAPRSRSGIFDIRPGDFKRAQRDGKDVLQAAPMIGPGDFACLEGFKQSPHQPGCYSDTSHAEMFDALSALVRKP